MPLQECYKMDIRLRFVARLLEGEKGAVLRRAGVLLIPVQTADVV